MNRFSFTILAMIVYSLSTSAASSEFEVAACRSSDAAILLTDAMLLYFMSLRRKKGGSDNGNY